MSNVETRLSIENTVLEFEILCNNLENIIKEHNLNTTIEKTKLGFYKRKIKEIGYQASDSDSIKLFNIINKLISLNILFGPNINIKIDYKDLLNILKGSCSFDDSDENYNDKFFELEIAIRFLKKIIELDLKDSIALNLNTDCDIIIGKKTAIECKYIHSNKRLEEHVKKAIKQIDKRIAAGLATEGIIAIDLTQIMDNSRFNKIAQEVFAEFYKINLNLSSYSFVSDSINNNILVSILGNTNFREILQSYHTAYLEQTFYENLNQSTKNKINGNLNVKAIMFQSRHLLTFNTFEGSCPVMNRGMTYYLNESISEQEKNRFKSIISTLAVGI